MSNKPLFRVKFALLFAMILWASAFVGIRYAGTEYSAGSLALLRYLVASLCMIPIYFKLKHRSQHNWREIVNAMLLGIFGFAIYNVALNQGEQTVSAGIASFIIGLSPVIVIIIASRMHHEHLNQAAKWGVAISLLGILLIAAGEVKNFKIGEGLFLVFISTISSAIYSVTQKKLLIKFHPIEFTAYAIWGGTLAMLVFTPTLWRELHHASLGPTLAIIYMGIFPGAIAYLCYSYAYKYMAASHAVTYTYAIPFFSIILAFIFLREIPTAFGLSGGVLALIGAVIASKNRIIQKA